MSVSTSKNNLVRELFVRTADENYITARWCAINQLETDFLWLSVHALEKYLKAVLLLNGRSAKRSAADNKSYSHDIERLYTDVKALAEELLPEKLVKPDALNIHHWHDQTPEQFMEHLHRNGNAHNRYLIYGYVTRPWDLHMLDAMVFAIRRLTCSLDERWLPNLKPEAPTFTHRELLARKPNHYGCLSMPLDKLIAARKETPKRTAALNLNLAFAPANYQHEPLRSGSSSRNSVVIRRILEPLENCEPLRAAEGVQVGDWFLKNVTVPEEWEKEIKKAIKAARKEHGLTE